MANINWFARVAFPQLVSLPLFHFQVSLQAVPKLYLHSISSHPSTLSTWSNLSFLCSCSLQAQYWLFHFTSRHLWLLLTCVNVYYLQRSKDPPTRLRPRVLQAWEGSMWTLRLWHLSWWWSRTPRLQAFQKVNVRRIVFASKSEFQPLTLWQE